MIKAVIFDLDGTLSYTLDSISYSGNLALEELGFAALPKDDYKYFCGDGSDELVKRVLAASGDTEYTRYTELRRAYGKFFRQYADYNVRPYEGMPEAIAALKEKGLKLAVLSNKPHPQTIEVVHKLYGDVFDYIQGNTPEINRKPSPDGAFIIAKELGIDTSEFLYVGDTATDMQTGNSAGMKTVGVLWGYRTLEELTENNAKMIISHPSELIDCL